jgi:hypothetical protein
MKTKIPMVTNRIVAFDRDQLNDRLKDHLDMDVVATSEQWQQVFDSIHDDNEAWSYMDDAINTAVCELADALTASLK